jgi:hypothetical protein
MKVDAHYRLDLDSGDSALLHVVEYDRKERRFEVTYRAGDSGPWVRVQAADSSPEISEVQKT